MQAGECGQPAQAGKRKQHNCGQTGKQNAGRKIPTARPQSDIYQPPITTRSVNTLSPASFLIQRTKSPVCSRFTPGASGAGHYLTSAISPAAILPAITAITSESPSCQQLLHRHRISLSAVLPPASLFLKALPASHQPQLPFSAFRNPKMHPHQSALHQYRVPRR